MQKLPSSHCGISAIQHATADVLPNDEESEMRRQTTPTKKKHVVLIYSSEYFKWLGKLPFHSLREQKTFALVRALGLLPQLQLVAPTKADKQAIEKLFHAKEYMDFLAKADDQTCLEEKERFGLVDDAYWFDGLFEYCQWVAGASITSAQALLHLMQQQQPKGDHGQDQSLTEFPHHQKRARDGKPCTPHAPVVINFGGGRHHAMRANASGFCYVNDVVLAIQTLLRKTPPIDKTKSNKCGKTIDDDDCAHEVESKHGQVERVVCVDLDIHHGDGVQEAFYFSEKVSTISFHLFEKGFFPGTGSLKEGGIGKGSHNNFNFPLKRGINDAQFKRTFDKVIRRVMDVLVPQVIVVICGVDTLARDPLGGFNLASVGICDCIRTLMSLSLPLVLFGGGGYHETDASKCHAAIVATVLDQTLPDQVPEHEFYEEYCKELVLATSPVIHMPNQNEDKWLNETCDVLFRRMMRKQAEKKNRITKRNKKRCIDEI